MSLVNQHGGDLELIERKYHIPKDELINFSGNVNPLGIADSIKKAIIDNIDCLCRYPDVSYLELRTNISKYTGVDKDFIIAGNGATELISLFIKVVSAKNAVIISPSYSEYEREIKLNNGEVSLYPLKEENDFNLITDEFLSSISTKTDMIVLCNPNNPTGTAVDTDDLKKILEYSKKNNIYVMIDETYMEFNDCIDKYSAVSLVKDFDNLFIIRGTSKFFAAPGLRLGYGLCSNKDILDSINSKKDPWSVNIFASVAGEVMFTDEEYISKTKKLISDERTKILNELKKWKNIKVYDTKSNFILIKILNSNITSSFVFEKLIAKKMIIRDASNFAFLGDEYLRFCILLPKQNKMLLDNLYEIIESN